MGIQKYRNQIFGDHMSMGTECDGDHLLRGINFMRIVCPGSGTKCVAANVMGCQIFSHFCTHQRTLID